MELLQPLSAFAQHLVTGLAFLVIFVVLYVWITPHKEVSLIREGNGAAALGLMGAIVGFSIALSQAISVSTSLAEAAIWSAIALVAQLLALLLGQIIYPKMFLAITGNNWAPAIVKAGAAISVGLINAACMTP
jgi:putative membrane protein